VRDEQRRRVRTPATFVDHVHAKAINRHLEVGQLVEPRFVPSPVEARPPVFDEVLEVSEAYAVVPASIVHLVRPPRTPEPLPQVPQDFLVNIDRARTGIVHQLVLRELGHCTPSCR
jgi:hypothetical protein